MCQLLPAQKQKQHSHWPLKQIPPRPDKPCPTTTQPDAATGFSFAFPAANPLEISPATLPGGSHH